MASRPPQSQPPHRSPIGSKLPKSASVYVDEEPEGVNPLHVIYGFVGVVGIGVIVVAVLVGLLALLFV